MIDEQRVRQWTKDAMNAMARHLDKNDQIAHIASIVLALLADREDREHWIQERT